MKFKAIMLGTAAFALLAVPATAATTKKHHHHAVAPASSVDARIDELEHEIHELRAEQTAQAQKTQEVAEAQTAPANQEVSAAQFEALQNQVYEQQASNSSLVKSSWWGNTKITGRFYWDVSNIDATGNVKTAAGSHFHNTDSPSNGFNFDLKRAYLMVDHKFNDTYSANLIADRRHL